MKEKLQWVKEHKKELLIGAGVAVGTTVFAVIGVKCGKAACKAFENAVDSGIDNRYVIDLEPVPICELGVVGREFLDHIPEADQLTVVQVVAWINKEDL